MGLLARREHTRLELRQKLARHAAAAFPDDAEAAEAALDAVLDRLQALGYLDEARAAEAVVRQQAAGMGVARLRQTLQHKGVAFEDMQAALDGLEGTEAERARALWQRRFAGQVPSTRSEWARQARFLTGRGFASDVVRQVLPPMPSDPPLAGRAAWSRSGRSERPAVAEPDTAPAGDEDGWVRTSRQRSPAPARSGWGRKPFRKPSSGDEEENA